MGLLNTISKNFTELSKPEIEGILYLILHEEGITNAELIRRTGIPKETLRRFKSRIGFLLQEQENGKILFKLEYRSKLLQEDPQPYAWTLKAYSDPVLEEALSEVRAKHNLKPNRKFDQFFATVNTSVAKVKVMQDRGDVKGKKIAFLGDDDLISITLGLSWEFFQIDYSDILVLDIDRNILSAINTIVAEHSFKNIRTEYYDARCPLRPSLEGRFDVVVIDPPYTEEGVDLFLRKSLQLLGAAPGGSIYLYYGNSYKTPEKELAIQQLFSRYKLLLKEKVSKFARYYGAESIGSASSLYLLQTFASTTIPNDVDHTHSQKIYTYEKK